MSTTTKQKPIKALINFRRMGPEIVVSTSEAFQAHLDKNPDCYKIEMVPHLCVLNVVRSSIRRRFSGLPLGRLISGCAMEAPKVDQGHRRSLWNWIVSGVEGSLRD